MGLQERVYGASPAWVRELLMNAHGVRLHLHRYGGDYRRLLEEFSALSAVSTGEIESYQARRLRAVVANALARSTFYRDRFAQASLNASDVGTAVELRQLPLLRKDELRSNLDAVLTAAPPQRGWLHGHTSGTTGSPLSLWYDRETCLATNAADRLQKRWAGVDDEEWVGLLLGRQVVPSRQSEGPFWHANHVQRQVWFSTLHMAPRTLPAYVAEIRRRRLRVLEGYPSTLYVLARHLVDAGETLPMQAVFSSSETLLDSHRETIEAAFEAPLFDFYGHAERAIFAIECRVHEGKHLVAPFGITEVVDADGNPVPDGQFGYLVGTSLFNTAMPMLRYLTGDVSAIDRRPCACGSAFPRIVNISTKAEDILVLPDGRWLSPSSLTHPFKPFPEIRESQIVQESTDVVRVRIAAGDDFTADREASLYAAFCERIGPGVTVHIERVHGIPRERSGKFRWVVSKVSHQLAVTWDSSDQGTA